jgi:membrane-associated phospholipid phosphatase
LFGLALLLGAGQTLWFALIFSGADWVTERRSLRVRLHLDFELAIPFVPAAVLGYLSIYPLFWMGPFVLRRHQELCAWVGTLAVATLCAGIVFLVFPGELLFPPSGDMGDWSTLVGFAKRLALRHNLMPSLHVTLSAVCVLVFAARAGPVGKVLLWSWSLVIAGSTLLLHQHYLVDVAAGYALGWACVRWVYNRAASLPAGKELPEPSPVPTDTSRGAR